MRAAAALSVALLANSLARAESGQKLTLNPGMVTDLFSLSAMNQPATFLTDEQDVAGDPRSGTGGNVTTPWNPVWQPQWYALTPKPQAFIDLGAVTTIDAIWFAHAWGQLEFNITMAVSSPLDNGTTFAVQVGGPGGNEPACGPICWANVTTSGASGRFIVFSLPKTTGGSLLEVVAYGSEPATEPAPAAVRVSASQPRFGDFIGANVVGAVSGVPNMTAITHARMYFDWDWAEAVQGQNNFQPALGVDFLMDDYLSALAEAKVGVHIAYQGTAPFIHDSNASQAKWKPLTYDQLHTPGASTDPASYTAYASSAFQVAARYGKVQVPASLLKLAPNQPVKSGLGTLGAFEAGNEWSGTWNGREAYFTPLEYAAFLSAAYDGHEGSMGPGMGVKTADPSMPVSIAGLAELANCSIDYLESMYLWSAQNRKDQALPADIISIHHYANNVNGPVPGSFGQGLGDLRQDPDTGIMPEADNLTARVAAYASWRDRRAPHSLLWWGEFGYDTYGGPQRSPAIGTMSAETVQAAWLVRSLFAIAAGGADGAQMFMMADVNSNQPYRFSSSGLVTDKTSFFQPKASWFVYNTLANTIADLLICGRADDKTADVAVAVLAPDCGQTASPSAWVVWSPTDTDRTVSKYALSVQGSAASTATVMRLQDKHPSGVNSTVPVASAKVVLDVMEMPAVVFA